MEVPLSDPQYAPSDSPSGYPSNFPVPDPTAMFQKSLQKAQMALPVVATSLSYAPEAALLQMESLKMIIQDAASSYPKYIPNQN